MSALLVPSPQVAQVLEQMNEASLRGEAFFFALDFELREALFELRPLEQPEPRSQATARRALPWGGVLG